jgi:hypothetical protein
MFRELTDFKGLWTLTRYIAQRNAPDAELRGSATMRPDADGLIYHEVGLLTVGDSPPVQAERRYLWRDGGNGAIEVLFEDGRAFHRIDPANLNDTHWCDPDTYDVTYDFKTWPNWSSTWRVRGPRKDYDMVTRYSFAGATKPHKGPHRPIAPYHTGRMH